MARFEVIVIGMGAMGSSTVYHLARRGRRVLGLERYSIPNDMGSSHGLTRIIRLAYFEHPSYVPLLRRAFEIWRELQQAAGEQLLHVTGAIDGGEKVFNGSLRSCQIHDLPHQVMDGEELHRRFPAYHLPAETPVLFQPDGGYLLPERCISSFAMLAQAHGAEIHGHEQVLEWEPWQGGVRVVTNRDTYEADRLVVAAGAWVSHLVKQLQGVANPERQVLAWFQPLRPELFTPEHFPVFNLCLDDNIYYGFPVHAIPGFKLGMYHHLKEAVDPDTMDRNCYLLDEKILRDFTARYFPDGAGPIMTLKTCIFTNTPDANFILDLHPDHPQVCIASPCSGHGFKFSSVVGEIMADLAEKGETRHDISLHRLARYAP